MIRTLIRNAITFVVFAAFVLLGGADVAKAPAPADVEGHRRNRT